MSGPANLKPGILTAIVSTVWRDVADMARNPLAFFGGMGGTAAVVGGLVAFFLVFGEGDAEAGDDTEELQMDFMPGVLAKLGEKLPEEEIPEKIITRDTRAPEASAPDAVTEDETPPPEDKPKVEPDKEKKKSKLPDAPKKDKKLPTSDYPTDKNTPYDDLPTVDKPIGDPFGSPQGWSDRMKDGDPWATAVLAKLNQGIQGAAYAAKSSATGYFQFRITICKDGTIKDVQAKGSSGDRQIDYSVQQSLQNLKIPRPPPDVAKQLKSACKRIPYTFKYNPKRGVN